MFFSGSKKMEQDSILLSNQNYPLEPQPILDYRATYVWLDTNMQAMKLTVVFTLMLYMAGLYP